MKRFYVFFALFFILVASVVQADYPDPCDDCELPGAEWHNYSGFCPDCFGCDDCGVYYTYNYRYNLCNTPPSMEVKVTLYYFTEECLENCTTEENILDFVMKSSVAYSFAIPLMSLSPGDCIDYFRDMNSACYTQEHINGTYVVSFCEEEHCCNHRYKICREEFFPYDFYIELVEPEAMVYICENGNPGFPQTCNIYSCGNHLEGYFLDGPWRISILQPNNNLECTVNISPNPTENIIMIDINNSNEGIHNFKLFDMLGNDVLNSSFKYSKDQNKYSIDCENLSNGIYFYQLTSESKQNL